MNNKCFQIYDVRFHNLTKIAKLLFDDLIVMCGHPCTLYSHQSAWEKFNKTVIRIPLYLLLDLDHAFIGYGMFLVILKKILGGGSFKY